MEKVLLPIEYKSSLFESLNLIDYREKVSPNLEIEPGPT